MFPNPSNGRVRSPWLEKNCDSNDLPVAGLIHQVRHHIEALTVNVLFARTMKVELRKLVALVSHNQEASGSRRVVVVHADRVSVVNQIFERADFGIEA